MTRLTARVRQATCQPHMSASVDHAIVTQDASGYTMLDMHNDSASIAYLYILPGMSDWETGFLASELNSGRYFQTAGARLPVTTVGATLEPITTMGGLTITPECTVADIDADATAVLILPGALDSWHAPAQRPIIARAREMAEQKVLIAAICDATVALANAGLLDNRAHTSNDLGVLEQSCVNYHGSSHFVSCGAVHDQSVITASGVAPLEFAYETIKTLGVWSEATLEAWLGLYQTHETHYFYELQQSLPSAR